MRTSFILALAACGAAYAASRAETTTYIDGNLTGVAPNTGATLTLGDEKTMSLRTGFESMSIPYEGISNAELGAVKVTSHQAPLYKVWALRKRAPKTSTQLLVVNFKNEDGEEKTMTLELAQTSAQSVLADLQTRSGKTFASTPKPAATPVATANSKPNTGKDQWWGDEYWKTSRNSEKWTKPASAPDQR